MSVTPSEGTQFTVTLTATSDITLRNIGCQPRLDWDDSSGSLSTQIPTGTRVSITSRGRGTNGVTTNGLDFSVPRRHSQNQGKDQYGPTPMYFHSKSGEQCYPSVQYSFWSPTIAQYGTNGSKCGQDGNNSSTIYPDGQCRNVKIRSGQASIPEVC